MKELCRTIGKVFALYLFTIFLSTLVSAAHAQTPGTVTIGGVEFSGAGGQYISIGDIILPSTGPGPSGPELPSSRPETITPEPSFSCDLEGLWDCISYCTEEAAIEGWGSETIGYVPYLECWAPGSIEHEVAWWIAIGPHVAVTGTVATASEIIQAPYTLCKCIVDLF